MNETAGTAGNRKKFIKVVGFALMVAAVIVLSHVPAVRDAFSFSKIHDLAASATEVAHKPYGPPLFVLISAAFLLLHLPELVVIVIGGIVYDFWLAFFLCWAGCSLGTTCTFLIARFFLQDYFKPKLEASFLRRFNERFEKDGIITMCFVRLILFVFPPVNWLVGATGIKIRDFIIGNILGIAPQILATLIAVKKIKEVNSPKELLQPESVGLVLAFIALFAVIAYIRKKYFFPTPKEDEDD